MGGLHKVKKNKILTIIILVLHNNPQGYKEQVVLLISFTFIEGLNITYCMENMKFYVYDIHKSNKGTIYGSLGNSGTSDLLLHIVQCWMEFAVYDNKWALPMVLWC